MRSIFHALVSGLIMLFLPTLAFAAATPYPPYPGAVPSSAYKVTVDGQSVFTHNFLTYDQFNWMDYASFSMTGKVHVTVTLLVSERKIMTCSIRPLAYNIQPKIEGNTVSFDLDKPEYLVLFFNDEPAFYSTGLMLFAEPPANNPPKLGDPNVVNINDYKIDATGKTVETAKINKAISDLSAKPGGGVLYFPKGIYQSGTVLMKSNVKLYVDLGAKIVGSSSSADYTSAPPPTSVPAAGGRGAAGGGRRLKAFFVFDNIENAGLSGPGTIDMEGYPWLWHDFQPDNADGTARDADGKIRDPGGNGIRGYVVNNCKNISFEDLLLERSAYWTVYVIGTQNFTTRNIKIVNRKQQYHDDAYDFSGDTHVLIQDGFAMTMDDTWAFYGGGGGGRAGAAGGAGAVAAAPPPVGIEDFVVKGFVNYTYTSGLAIGYGGAPPVKHLLFQDVNFITNHNKFAIWIQLTPAYFTGRGYSSGSRISRNAALDDFHFLNCTFENDGGQIYIDSGDRPITNMLFENCTFYKPNKPGEITGKGVGPITFKNVTMNGELLKSTDQMGQMGFDISVPAKFVVTPRANAPG